MEEEGVSRALTYWGKAGREGATWHPLPCHSLDVAAVACAVLDASPGLSSQLERFLGLEPPQVQALAAFLTALHDLGKFSVRFQAKRGDLLQGLQQRSHGNDQVRHADAGWLLWTSAKGIEEQAIEECWSGAGYPVWHHRMQPLMAAAIGHHGLPPSLGHSHSVHDYFEARDVEAALAFAHWVRRRFLGDVALHSLSDPQACRRASWLIAGLTVLADWIASEHMPHVGSNVTELDAYWEQVQPLAQDAVKRKSLRPLAADAGATLTSLFPHLTEPTDLQRWADELELGDAPGLFILEARTGSGKTEAAVCLAQRLMAAGRAEGLYFALPTMATADGIYERVEGFHARLFAGAQKPGVLLSHSARGLNTAFLRSLQPAAAPDDAQEDDDSILAQGLAFAADHRKLSFMAQIGVGTVDQALLTVLPAKHQSLGMLGLSRRVLIVDEVHAYDAFTSQLLAGLLRFHAALGGSAILLSATLPRGIKESLAHAYLRGRAGDSVLAPDLAAEAYPLLTHVTEGQRAVETPLSPEVTHAPTKPVRVGLCGDASAMVTAVLAAAAEGASVAWVRNTVDDALTAYTEMLAAGADPERTHLFHARMALGDRHAVEAQIVRCFGSASTPPARHGRVLVATQVVEQSLDLDFDSLFSDLAPIDLLLQRAGRLHRHRRDAEGRRLTEPHQADGRPDPMLTVLSALPAADAPESWYSSLLPRAAYVYRRHDLLWLTAQLIQQRGGWDPATEPRDLVEAVYGPEVTTVVPAALKVSAERAVNEEKMERSHGAARLLDLGLGYGGNTGTHWNSPEHRETRLGLPTMRFRLGVWDGATLRPLCVWETESPGPWALWERSVIQLPQWRVEKALHHGDALLVAVARTEKALPDKGRYAPLLVLTESAAGLYRGEGVNAAGKPIVLRYSHTRGMEFGEEET